MANSKILPFFPLGLVSFPLQPLNLHIFEQRYRQMFNEIADRHEGEFVQVPVIDSRIQPFATVHRLVDVAKRYPSGELDVKCIGVRLVLILSYEEILDNKLYSGGEVENVRITLTADDPEATALLIDRCRTLLELLGVERSLPEPDDEGISYALGHWLGLQIAEEYELLLTPSETHRQKLLIKWVESRILTAGDTQELRRRALMNGHFRHFPNV